MAIARHGPQRHRDTMLSISIGPFAVPLAPLLLLLAIWVAYLLATRVARRRSDADLTEAAGSAVFNAAVAGLLAARLAHVALLADAYLKAPWSMVDLRDGGWHLPTGILAGTAWLAWQGWRSPALRRPLAIGGAAGLAFWLAVYAATNLAQPQTMPSLPLTELDGGAQVTLAQAARGQPVVVNLWASWCGPCRHEMPVLAAAQQREVGVGILFVNQGETVDEVRTYLRDSDLQLRDVLLDPGSALLPAVGSRGLPTTLFYDSRGQLVDAHFGVLSAASLESRLRQLRDAN
jgi:thiol-disulfide isomerase/thioredoxin